MKSIKSRLLASYIVLILVTTFIFDFSAMFLLRQYYQVSIREVLTSQAEVSANFYDDYMKGSSLHNDYNQIINILFGYSSAQVQVIDSDAVMLADSKGFHSKGDHMNYPDVEKALDGEVASWHGRMEGTDGRVLAVSYPLRNSGSVIGVVRLVTSLARVDAALSGILLVLICITAVITFIAGLLSLFLSSTIVNPVKEITRAAEKLAEGNYKVHLEKKRDDEIGKLADTLKFMSDELVNHQELKNNFIASVSHELRTPLTSIKGWAITLKSGGYENSDELYNGFAIIENECDRLTLLVDELLDFSKYAAGKLSLNLDMVDIKRLIRYIYSQMKPRAERQGLRLEMNCAGDTMQPVDTPAQEDTTVSVNTLVLKADENRLKQVLINILDNSFKYTPPGGRISISEACDGKQVLISIKDTGCGIDPDDLSRVKQKFFKGRNALTGNGLGLSISDEIVRMHGGELSVRSSLSEGTQVDIVLPLNHSHNN